MRGGSGGMGGGAPNAAAVHSEAARGGPQPHMSQQNQMRFEQRNAPQGGVSGRRGWPVAAVRWRRATLRRIRKLRRALRAHLLACRVRKRAKAVVNPAAKPWPQPQPQAQAQGRGGQERDRGRRQVRVGARPC